MALEAEGAAARASSICSSEAVGVAARPEDGICATMSTYTLEQAAKGLETTIEVPRTESCPTCHGSGAKPGTSPMTCSNCRGTGQVTRAQNTPFGQMVTSSACTKCGGRGQIITSPCGDCSGTGRVHKTRKINIKIPPGVEDGQHLKLRGQGDAAGRRARAATFMWSSTSCLIHKFQRVDSDLLMETPISFTQAALGADVGGSDSERPGQDKSAGRNADGNRLPVEGKGHAQAAGHWVRAICM